MKKIYVDTFGTRISGQLIMQQNLKDEVIRQGLYAEENDADYLVYVQLPANFDISVWENYKAQGKKIVFIHHYFANFENFNIFKIPGALELVDLNICISEQCDTYRYIRARLGENAQMLAYEQVCVNQATLFAKYFKVDHMKTDSICFVGRVNKGVHDFIDFCENKRSLWYYKKTIFTVGKENEILELKEYLAEAELSDKYELVVAKQGEELYKLFSENRFVYMNADMIASENHFETVMHEAMAIGVIVVLGPNQRRYITASDEETGFVTKDFDFLYSINETELQIKQYKYLISHFDNKDAVMNKNIRAILNCN